jgi:hypothetical protein
MGQIGLRGPKLEKSIFSKWGIWGIWGTPKWGTLGYMGYKCRKWSQKFFFDVPHQFSMYPINFGHVPHPLQNVPHFQYFPFFSPFSKIFEQNSPILQQKRESSMLAHPHSASLAPPLGRIFMKRS